MVVFLCAHKKSFVDKAFKVFYEELLCEKQMRKWFCISLFLLQNRKLKERWYGDFESV
jgi:hypothetical protein